jgi:hypothetical protein
VCLWASRGNTCFDLDGHASTVAMIMMMMIMMMMMMMMMKMMIPKKMIV